MRTSSSWLYSIVWWIFLALSDSGTNQPVFGQEPPPGRSEAETRAGPVETTTSEPPRAEKATPLWRYGGFIDLDYSLDFNFPANHLFRNRSTTPRVNELDVNMGGIYLKKEVTEQSRLGMDLLVHGGQDAKDFAFENNQPKVAHSDWYRQFGRANVSYLAPVGNGLTVQAGLFNSFIGYDSLYAKDNFSYTRPWGGDYTPYLMFGVNATYPFNDHWAGSVFIINEYFHLTNTNSVPSYGGQLAYKSSHAWTVKETIYYGPDQSNTSMQFWRFFSDSIVEWKRHPITIAFEYQIGTEELATPSTPRVLWTAAQLPIHWIIHGPWSATVRPEFYWDPNGRLTGARQFITAMTTTLEYKFPYLWTHTIARLEYRYDDSRGPGGGFYKGGQMAAGVIGLTPAQHLLIFALIWTFDSP
ncbi:MAG TPA: outer membrane beta-barrel protein [Nitrospiraceae bacterium]|nr:outer membrane beta-barrel protein [Nitrospiraceae bacterium]